MAPKLAAFKKRMLLLFVDLRVLDQVPGGLREQTNTYLAIHNAKEAPPITVDGQEFHLWHEPKMLEAVARAPLESMKRAVAALFDRLDSEVGSKDLRMDFIIFHLPLYHRRRLS